MMLVSITKYLFVPLLGFLVTYLLTPLVIRWAPRVGLLDLPDARRIHKTPTPRGGGLAVIIGFHAACAAAFLMPWGVVETTLGTAWWLQLLGLSLPLLLLGLWDDIRNLRPHIKLLGQIFISAAAYACGLRMHGLLGILLPEWLDLIATIVWFVAVMNAFNLIDGMDGLAAGLGVIAAAGMAGAFLIMDLPGNALVMLGLLGTCLAFLRFNFHPARIFLGDTGSLFLGFIVAAVALSTQAKGLTVTAIAMPFLAVGIPLFDTFLAIWRRVARKLLHRLSPPGQSADDGRQLFGADLEHLHHRLLSHGFSQRKVALYLYGVSAVLVGVNWLAMLYKGQTVGLYLLVFAAAAFVVIRHVAHVELWNSSLALASGLRRPPLKQLTVPLYLAADVALLAGAFVVSHLCFLPHAAHEVVRQWLLRDAVVGVGVPLLCLIAGSTYQRVWSRLSGIDCIMLTWWLLIGVVLGVGVLSFFAAETPGVLLAEMGLYFIFALVALLGIRIFPRFVAGCLTYMSRGYNPDNEQRPRILIYGAGSQGMLFLRAEGQRVLKKARQYTVVGFLDDDPNLHDRLVCGYKVLGGLADLECILQKNQIDQLILTFELSGTALVALQTVLEKYPVTPLLWRTTLLPLEGGVMPLHLLRESPCPDGPAQARPPLPMAAAEGHPV
jgi:UDP-N-acetylmuramyl pentapeptide phosphotransferase/UDP-N-acetylglucosamine-1-phosphate transferase